MIKLNEIYELLDSKISSGKPEYFEIIHERFNSTIGSWYIKTSKAGEKTQVVESEPTNYICFYKEIYNYLINKYGEEVDIIIPLGIISTEQDGVEIFVKELYVKCISVGLSFELCNWIDQL